ncbi:uncharacterized protein LOC111711178 isoform X2 [Eurytemora carolleeae]|uniref:uncharacterized protein LOC111711178 isoform X2 n=1 Tax=Eurytemora carolleeae TaxID=1294199 RepID=UPI000C75F1E2|nr:uncharacterized protein LOC111711178 isoform X2 [Eurytemora carolleeae]|eukprot:XP_023341226.1 uncharacterized protein LOC111711178 isoform X2 [Eurytemora affinis]
MDRPPPSNENTTDKSKKGFRKWRRKHGLQFPLHPQQVLCWIFLLTFTLYTFLTLLPAVHTRVQLPLTILSIFIFSVHYISHLVSILLDPSDPNLLALYSKKPVPELDRRKHSHVIENGRCNLCSIFITSNKTKHCSVCNKCVHGFDHHCKWLNQCIGFVILGLGEVSLYYTDTNLLAPWQNYTLYPDCSFPFNSSPLPVPGVKDGLDAGGDLGEEEELGDDGEQVDDKFAENETSFSVPSWRISTAVPIIENNSFELDPYLPRVYPCHENQFLFFLNPVPDFVFITTTILMVCIAAVSAGLLMHLCIFHIYININDMTTYDYVRAQRQDTIRESSARNAPSAPPASLVPPALPAPPATPSRPSSPGKCPEILFVCSTCTCKHHSKVVPSITLQEDPKPTIENRLAFQKPRLVVNLQPRSEVNLEPQSELNLEPVQTLTSTNKNLTSILKRGPENKISVNPLSINKLKNEIGPKVPPLPSIIPSSGGLRKLQFLLEGADESKFTQVTRGTPGTSVEQEDDSGVDSSQNSRRG